MLFIFNKEKIVKYLSSGQNNAWGKILKKCFPKLILFPRPVFKRLAIMETFKLCIKFQNQAPLKINCLGYNKYWS